MAAQQAQSASPGATVSIAGSAKSQTVRYGGTVAIAGRVLPGTSGRAVRLEHAPGRSGYRQVATSRTTADGSYRFTVRPRSSGSYRAVADGAATSTARRITVVAAVAGRSARHVLGTRPVRVRGKLLPAQAQRLIKLQVLTRRGWRTVDRERTGRSGRFSATFRPRRAGAYRLRVRFSGDRTAAAATDRLAKVRVYRPGHASWYGPGLYGNSLGCGGRLSQGTLGVAHKSLPCGSRVTFRYRGRSVTVRVVDRGPYVGGREWDLTAATKAKLGFGSTGTVWSTR